MRREALAVLSMMLLAAVAGAQEDVREHELAVEAEESGDRRRRTGSRSRSSSIRTSIASFYRSAEGGYFWAPAYPMDPGGYYGRSATRGQRPLPDRGLLPPARRLLLAVWTGGYGYGGWGGYGGHGGHGAGRAAVAPRPGFGGGRRPSASAARSARTATCS